jgi:hypothetical protein
MEIVAATDWRSVLRDSRVGSAYRAVNWTLKMHQKWLYEDDVVDAVCGYLERHGYTCASPISPPGKNH